MKSKEEKASTIVQAIVKAQDAVKKLAPVPVALVCKPYLLETMRYIAGESSQVFAHAHQKEELLLFYDLALLRKHLNSMPDHCVCRHHLLEHAWADKERDECKLCDCQGYVEPEWLEGNTNRSGFTVIPAKGFDVTAALKERGEWPDE